MDSTTFHQWDRSRDLLIEFLWYGNVIAFFFIVVFYVAFAYFLNIQEQTNRMLHNDFMSYGTHEQRASESRFLEQKRKIEDFGIIVANKKVASHVFGVMEQSTLSDVWFSSFDLFLFENRLELVGEAETMGTLSQQIQIFEEHHEYIESVTVSHSQISETGRARFILSVSFNPNVFMYWNSLLSV